MSSKAVFSVPSQDVIERDLEQFAARLANHYGDRLRGVYLFGSRARGGARGDSDADVVVVLTDGFDLWSEVSALSDLGYDLLTSDGVDIQAHPISEEDWKNPERHVNPRFVSAARRDARSLVLPR